MMFQDKAPAFRSRIRLWAAVAALWLAGLASHSQPVSAQQSEAQFFQGKTVRILVGYGVGGGYDVYARMLAPYLSKRFGANFIVENMPGAGGVAALNRLAVSPPDGLTAMLISGNAAALAQLAEQSGVRYDLAELSYLGTVSSSPWLWLTSPMMDLKSPLDATGLAAMTWGATGPMDGPSDGAAFLCEALKLKCKIVLGYRSTAEVALAMAKGEIDMQYLSDTSANSAVKAKNAKPLSVISRDRSRFFPETPRIFDQMTLDADQTWLVDFRSTLESLGRILALPGKMPPARLKLMQELTAEALRDPALLEEGERSQRYVGHVDAETTYKRVLSIVRDLSAEQKARVIGLLSSVK